MGTYPAAPSLYASSEGPSLDGAAVLGISQSGQSPDVARVLHAARAQHRPTIAITNEPQSPLAQAADVVVPLLAGAELSVAATKTYMGSLQALLQIAESAGAPQLREGLDRLPELAETVVSRALDHATSLATVGGLSHPDPLTVVGRGTGHASAAEIALKIREVAGVRAEAYTAPDLLHGPVAANVPGSSLWVIASPSYPMAYWEQLMSRLTRSGVRVTAVVPDEADEISADLVLPVPVHQPGWLFDLVAVIYGQSVALRLGEREGLDVDKPRSLAKVTLTL